MVVVEEGAPDGETSQAVSIRHTSSRVLRFTKLHKHTRAMIINHIVISCIHTYITYTILLSVIYKCEICWATHKNSHTHTLARTLWYSNLLVQCRRSVRPVP